MLSYLNQFPPTMNEADTRVILIEPKLKSSGWTDRKVTREFYYNRDHQYAPGRIILAGDRVRRGESRKADYILRLTEGFPIAVVEAKPDEVEAETGLEQAKSYAKDLNLPFAYATNGNEIIEYDFFTKASRNLDNFPRPEELLERFKVNTGIELTEGIQGVAMPKPGYRSGPIWQNNPLLHPYCPETQCGKKPHYFQEAAISEVIKRMMRGQRRILLAMATGTGKTFVSFQIVWKLIQSGWLARQHPDKPARVLFLADRVVLRGQAYNTFSPLANGTSDPRHEIKDHPPNLNRDIYFGIYQTLWSPDANGHRLFELFPRDFFDLVIIDECHRSGFGTWREILDHFESAIHLGMTATPKQDENIDTYAYFCDEEPEIAIDPEHPELGNWKPPAYQYSLGRGIEDGFLSTYKVHRVRTTVDKDGLHLQDAFEQGAEVFIPDDVDPLEEYHTPQFEREITLPDRTTTMVKHLSGLLRRFGHMDKTMIFCVDMDHARVVARLLQDEFGAETGLDNYALPIISEEGKDAQKWLENFADSDKKAPVVATTAELLSTGVDVPSCKNIVFMKTLSSPILFKQIIGRGSRIDQATDKYWFRIIDFTGVTRLFDEWDRPGGKKGKPPEGPFTATLKGVVVHANTGDRIEGASVSIRTGPNTQQGPIRTDRNGEFIFTQLPAGNLGLICNATGFVRRELHIETIADETVEVEIGLKPIRKGSRKIKVTGLEVTIADEAIFLIENTGQQLNLDEYRDYARKQVIKAAPTQKTLRDIWVNPAQRSEFLKELEKASINSRIIADIIGHPEADTFDLLSNLAFGSPIHTRSERAVAFRNREQSFIDQHNEEARRVILALLEKYRLGGVEQFESNIFSVSPFREWGGAITISKWFGDVEALRITLDEIQQRIYPDTEVA